MTGFETLKDENRPPRVILIEDDDVDVEAIKRAFKRAGLKNRLVVCRDGADGMKTLRGMATREDKEEGMIVLLDINLPKMGGLELLSEVRKDPDLKGSVVFALSTSNAQTDRNGAYDLNVAGYLVKSRLGKDLNGLTNLLSDYSHFVEFAV